MTNKKPFKLQRGCHTFATFFATCNAYNNKQDGGRAKQAKDELWLAHSDKIALQVAEGMLHASNLSRNVAKSLATCNATFVALQVARKIASCNMALSSPKYAKLVHFMLLGSFSTPRWRRRRERHQTKGLMSRTIAVHVRWVIVIIILTYAQ